MNELDALAFASKLGQVMMSHPELFHDIVDMIEKGMDPDVIKKAIKDLKVTLSDVVMQKELGL